jgi:hypothetical protein
MPDRFYDLHGTRILEYAMEGPLLRTDRDAVAIIEHALAQSVRFIVIPAARLDPDFFVLRTRVAGEMLQKFVTYGFRIAILGDFSLLTAESDSLRDFLVECNRGDTIWFLPGIAQLDQRLQTGARS